jgi:hypothetical protein
MLKNRIILALIINIIFGINLNIHASEIELKFKFDDLKQVKIVKADIEVFKIINLINSIANDIDGYESLDSFILPLNVNHGEFERIFKIILVAHEIRKENPEFEIKIGTLEECCKKLIENNWLWMSSKELLRIIEVAIYLEIPCIYKNAAKLWHSKFEIIDPSFYEQNNDVLKSAIIAEMPRDSFSDMMFIIDEQNLIDEQKRQNLYRIGLKEFFQCAFITEELSAREQYRTLCGMEYYREPQSFVISGAGKFFDYTHDGFFDNYIEIAPVIKNPTTHHRKKIYRRRTV